MPDFILPSKVFTYLRRLVLNYDHSGSRELASVIKNGLIAIEEDKDRTYDFGEESYGHDVVIFLAAEHIAPISLPIQAKLTDKLREDLAGCARGVASPEYFHAVRIELVEENDPLYQSARSLSREPQVNPDTLTFWKQNQIRVFISHRDTYKSQAHALSEALEGYGISCFVAHDTIEPTKSWQQEIEKALATMEAMIALITQDFHESLWTNQEVGFAKARNVPIISLKAGNDPRGFIGDKQALPAEIDNIKTCATPIYKLLRKLLGVQGRISGAIISAFCTSPNWGETTIRFDRMDDLVDELSDRELDQIKTAFEKNSQLNGANYLYNRNRFINFLTRTTGQKYFLSKGKIVPDFRKDEVDDEIPF